MGKRPPSWGKNPGGSGGGKRQIVESNIMEKSLRPWVSVLDEGESPGDPDGKPRE